MIKDLTEVQYSNDLQIASSLDIRFHSSFESYPTDLVIKAMDKIGIFK